MEIQEMFDKAVSGVLKQGAPSVKKNPYGQNVDCRYRDGYGNKCAIGHLFSDSLYNPKWEGGSIDPYLALDMRLVSDINDTRRFKFLKDLQRCHDDATEDDEENFAKTFREKVKRLAVNYSLNTSVLDTAKNN